MAEQLDALRAMSPRSALQWLVQMGLEKEDWEELLAMGEAAKMQETIGGNLAARVERWNVVAKLVNGYCGLALTCGHLDFCSEEHEAWCDRIDEQVALNIGDSILTSAQQRRFDTMYSSVVG